MATPTQKQEGAVVAHVSSATFYMAVFATLIALTIVTVGQSYVDLGRMNLIVVVIIASMKASLVVLFFMHLRWDSKFNALILITCLLFIGIFFAYTLNDTDRRGETDSVQNVKVLPSTGERAPGGFTPGTPSTGIPALPQPHEPAEAAGAGEHH